MRTLTGLTVNKRLFEKRDFLRKRAGCDHLQAVPDEDETEPEDAPAESRHEIRK